MKPRPSKALVRKWERLFIKAQKVIDGKKLFLDVEPKVPYVDIADLDLTDEQTAHITKWFGYKTCPLVSKDKFTVYTWDLESWYWSWIKASTDALK